MSTSITPKPRPGLVWFSVRVRVLPSGDVIVTGGKLVASVRRVTSMRPPTEVARSASSSRSGSFISQCATLRTSSGCGPPPSMPRFHSHR